MDTLWKQTFMQQKTQSKHTDQQKQKPQLLLKGPTIEVRKLRFLLLLLRKVFFSAKLSTGNGTTMDRQSLLKSSILFFRQNQQEKLSGKSGKVRGFLSEERKVGVGKGNVCAGVRSLLAYFLYIQKYCYSICHTCFMLVLDFLENRGNIISNI